jgi:glucokinase
MAQLIVNGDIGGTNARMQMWSVDSAGASPRLRLDRRYPSRDFGGIEALVRRFLIDCGLPVAPEDGAADDGGGGGGAYSGEAVGALCLAICGPVDASESRSMGPVLPEQGPTGWGADTGALLAALGPRVLRRACLINDFVAVGFGVPAVPAEDLVTLCSPPGGGGGGGARGVKAAVGAGTGLGAVFLTWQGGEPADGGYYAAHASEGGMAEFQAHSEQTWALRQWLVARDGAATVEHVVSGPGLVNCFLFLANGGTATGGAAVPAGCSVLGGVPKDEQPAAVVAGAEGGDAHCAAALDMFVRSLAAHLRLTALHLLPTAGLYIAGGIAPRILPKLQAELPALFVADPVMGEFIGESFPLLLIKDDDCGLLGARARAERLLREPLAA